MAEPRAAWSPQSWRGFEDLCLEDSRDGVVLDGLALALLEGVPLRVAYKIRCDAAWRVRSVRIDRGMRLSDGEVRRRRAEVEGVPGLDGCTTSTFGSRRPRTPCTSAA